MPRARPSAIARPPPRIAPRLFVVAANDRVAHLVGPTVVGLEIEVPSDTVEGPGGSRVGGRLEQAPPGDFVEQVRIANFVGLDGGQRLGRLVIHELRADLADVHPVGAKGQRPLDPPDRDRPLHLSCEDARQQAVHTPLDGTRRLEELPGPGFEQRSHPDRGQTLSPRDPLCLAPEEFVKSVWRRPRHLHREAGDGALKITQGVLRRTERTMFSSTPWTTCPTSKPSTPGSPRWGSGNGKIPRRCCTNARQGQVPVPSSRVTHIGSSTCLPTAPAKPNHGPGSSPPGETSTAASTSARAAASSSGATTPGASAVADQVLRDRSTENFPETVSGPPSAPPAPRAHTPGEAVARSLRPATAAARSPDRRRPRAVANGRQTATE